MDAIHLHLVLTHVPIVGMLFVSTTFLWSALTKNDSVGRFANYATIATALMAIPAYLAGMAAEERVEHLPWITEGLIDYHENVATIALVFSLAICIFAIVSIIINKKSGTIKTKVLWFMFMVALINFAILGFTGNRGGLVGHPEIRGDNLYKGITEKFYYDDND